jgi:hypothetical protein
MQMVMKLQHIVATRMHFSITKFQTEKHLLVLIGILGRVGL